LVHDELALTNSRVACGIGMVRNDQSRWQLPGDAAMA
jgi:hypothetical protein